MTENVLDEGEDFEDGDGEGDGDIPTEDEGREEGSEEGTLQTQPLIFQGRENTGDGEENEVKE